MYLNAEMYISNAYKHSFISFQDKNRIFFIHVLMKWSMLSWFAMKAIATNVLSYVLFKYLFITFWQIKKYTEQKFKVFTQHYVQALIYYMKWPHCQFFVWLSKGVISTLFKIVQNDALNLTFGCDPRPWSLRNIKTLLCLVQFCSKLLDCFSVAKWNAVSLNMKKKNYIEISSASESLVYYLKQICLGQNIKWM